MHLIHLFMAFKVGFLEISLVDVLDIIMFGSLMYMVYRLLRGGLAYNILIGLFLIYLMWRVTEGLGMTLMANMLSQFVGAGVLLVVIIFQPELRRFLLFIGKGSGIGKDKFWRRFLSKDFGDTEQLAKQVEAIKTAVTRMSKTKTGAIIVFADGSDKQFFLKNCVKVEATISQRLLESIFEKGAPLHDGAVIILDQQIFAAATVLPVSENNKLPAHLGLRHRAAVGVTEHIDSVVVIVSEETGFISVAMAGKIQTNVNEEVLQDAVEKGLALDLD